MTESYEQLRDQATGEGAEAWREADHEQGKLLSLYASLKEDPRYSEEHKAEKAWAAYEEAKEKIAGGRERAKELLTKQARSAERSSIPVPDGEGLITTDTTKLLASQNEASRIVRKIDRIDASGKGGPLKPDRLAVLREEYGRALVTGGTQGGIVCRGVLAAADELGIDADSVVGGFRKDRHLESLERAQQSERLVQSIGGGVPEPPFVRPGGTQRNGSGSLFLPRNRPVIHAASRPPWK